MVVVDLRGDAEPQGHESRVGPVIEAYGDLAPCLHLHRYAHLGRPRQRLDHLARRQAGGLGERGSIDRDPHQAHTRGADDMRSVGLRAVVGAKRDFGAGPMHGFRQAVPPGHHAGRKRSVCRTAPSGPRTSTRTPAFPVTGSWSVPSGGSGIVALVTHPWCTLTRASRASRRASAIRGRVTGSPRTLPPPWVCGSIAFGPINATRSTLPAASASRPREVLRRANDRAVASRSKAGSMRATVWPGAGPGPVPSAW